MTPKGRATEDQLIAFAAGGEQVVALVRLVLIGCIFVIPLVQIVYYHAAPPELLAGIGALSGALVLATVFYLLARNPYFHPWLSYVTSVVDVTLVSAVLAAFLVLNQPMLAVNSRVTWEVYLLAIGTTALRPRRGIVIMVTAVAIVEYLVIVLVADVHWNLNSSAMIAEGYGYFEWPMQISRLVLLAAAGVLSAALVRRITRISRLAGTDSLTGVFNRTYFNLRLSEEVQRARRYRHPLTLVMVDIDHFKAINDTFGHDFGDMALIRITRHLASGLRATDILFRHGGDELAILMPETSSRDAYTLMTRIVKSLRELRLKRHTLTVSVGIATFPTDAYNVKTLVHAADSNLYAAKDRGRDCIVGTPQILRRDIPRA